MSHGRDTLHLDRVHLLEGVVENSGSINYLPPHVAVVEVSDEEGLGRERVRLDVDVRAGDLVDEGRLSDVGVSTDKECSSCWIDCGETGYMLANLLKVGKRIFLAAHDCSHTARSLVY